MKNLSTLLLIIVSVIGLSSCGQKGPLILEEVPVDQTQPPLENSLDVIPVETDGANEDDADDSADEPDSAE